MKALEMKSSSEMFLHNYESAIVSLRFLLEKAFILKDHQQEFVVYEKMALCYFYLSDLERSNYYCRRMMRGLFEPDSDLRKIYIQLRENYSET